MGWRFGQFGEEFAAHFRLRTRDVRRQSQQYLQGLMQASKKNMERMAEVVPDSDEQVLQHFLSNSTWDERGVLDQVALGADALLGGSEDSALLIDESSFTKKGDKSVGVARQWSGRLGKVDNCQVGVFAALCKGSVSTLIDTRLYLPKVWAQDKRRCRAAGVPAEARRERSKVDLALDMVGASRRLDVRFQWVIADGGYGKDPQFLRALEEQGERFMVDVHQDQHIYLEDPKLHVPPSTNNRGRKRSRLHAQVAPVQVKQWLAAQPNSAWQRVTLRDSTKGKLRVEVIHRRVWLWDGREPRPHEWHLVVRREVQAPHKIKYSVSNAAPEVSVRTLASAQGQRFWVERCFQDAKSHVGMDDYQARGWTPWHHHMALVMMAMLFMLRERVEHHEELPLLSCADLEILLAQFLPRRNRDPDEIIRQMTVRHEKRRASIEYAYAKQQLE